MTRERLDAIRDGQMRIAGAALRRIEDRAIARRTPSVFEQFKAFHEPATGAQTGGEHQSTVRRVNVPTAAESGPRIAACAKRQVTVAERNRGLT